MFCCFPRASGFTEVTENDRRNAGNSPKDREGDGISL